MSPLSGPYERSDLPVAEKQSWTPVPPYIPRIHREKLCSASSHVVPTSSPPDAASSWWKAPLWNWKSSSSSSSSTSLSSVSAHSAADKVQSAETLPAKDPAPLVSAGGAPRPSASGPIPNVWTTEHSVSRFPSQTLYKQQGSVEVQHHVSKRDGVLLAQALAVKQSHNVLSWQVIFSGARQPHSLSSIFYFVCCTVLFSLYSDQLVGCYSSLSWLSEAKSFRVCATAEQLNMMCWGSSCSQFDGSLFGQCTY